MQGGLPQVNERPELHFWLTKLFYINLFMMSFIQLITLRLISPFNQSCYLISALRSLAFNQKILLQYVIKFELMNYCSCLLITPLVYIVNQIPCHSNFARVLLPFHASNACNYNFAGIMIGVSLMNSCSNNVSSVQYHFLNQ